MKIYVVRGSTGEYDDYIEWCVKAFTKEEKAQELVENANNWLKENQIHYSCFNRKKYKYSEKYNSPFDEFLGVNYTGSGYDYFELELIDE